MSSKPTKKGLSDFSIWLVNHGVAPEALYTTLKKEGKSSLTRILTEEDFYDNNGRTRWFVFYPKWSTKRNVLRKNLLYCDLIFNLFLKEYLILTKKGKVAGVNDLYSDILSAGSDTEYAIGRDLRTRITTTDGLTFIDDFVEHVEQENIVHRTNGVPIQETFGRAMLHSGRYSNTGFVLQSVVPPEKINGGWPDRIMSRILSPTTRVIEIEAPGD